MKYHKWTKSDEEKLKESYPHMPNRQIAKIFGVSKIAINHKARRLGLNWSQKTYSMRKVICDYCGEPFVKRRCYVQRVRHHFCSMECRDKWMRAHSYVIQPNLLPSPTLAYVCGVLLGDGMCYNASQGKNKGFTYAVALEVTEKPFARSFLQALWQVELKPRMFPIKKSGDRQDTWYVKGYSKKFYEWWIKQTLSDFQKMFFKEEGMLKEFIRGFYESEGSYYKQHRQLCNADYKIILLFQKALSQLGFESSIYRNEQRWKDFYRDKYDVESWKEFLYILYIRGGQHEQNRFIELIKPCIKNSLT